MTIRIDIWTWRLDEAADAAFADALNAEERERAARFINETDRMNFRARRGGLRAVLSGYAGVAANDLHIGKAAGGRPVLDGGPLFSMSDSGSLACVAVAEQGVECLGADIEFERVVPLEGLARRFLSPREFTDWSMLAEASRQEGFFALWTLKEAFTKALGTGMRTRFRTFTIAMDRSAEGIDARLGAIDPDVEPEPERWRLTPFSPEPGCAGALAVKPLQNGAMIELRPRRLRC